MSRKSKKSRSATKKQAQAAKASPEPTRRATLKHIRNGAIALGVFGVVGVFSVRGVRATIAEQNLERIGKGTPTVVQIHDPQCSLCTALQRQTRRALRSFEDGQIEYLVANITTPEGSALARRHGVPHVTLLLFDGEGNLESVLNGPRQADKLRTAFAAHLANHGTN